MNIQRDISYEDVIEVCRDLKKNKKAISAIVVREILGSGSYSTISKYINNWRANVKIKYNICSKCNGKGKVKARDYDCVESSDINKMKKIIKNNNLKLYQLADILGISQAAVSGWFKLGTNVKGQIKKIYFDVLKIKGYK